MVRSKLRGMYPEGNQDWWHVEPRRWFQSVGRAIHRGQKSGVAVYRHNFSNRAGLAAV
jgi:hypothetical protein